MVDSEFHSKLDGLRQLVYREDFWTAMTDVYLSCAPAKCAAIRDVVKGGTLVEPKGWRNPTDYFRSDLTREQRVFQRLVRMCIDGVSEDFRDDLCSLASLYHNLILSERDADKVLEEIAERSDANMSELIRGFVRRVPEDKSLEAFDLQIVETPEGPVVDRKG